MIYVISTLKNFKNEKNVVKEKLNIINLKNKDIL